MDDFHAGVTACLRSWSALRTAVESGWGGGTRESYSKAEDLRRNILDIMNGSKCPPANFSIEDLQDNLAIYMEEEFSVTLEDNSEQQVAIDIFRMYEGCCSGDPSFARHVVAQATNAVAVGQQFPVKVQTTEHDDDDDDEDMMDTAAGDTVPQLQPFGAVPQHQQQQPPAPQQQSNIPLQQTTALTTPAEYAAAPLFGQALPTPKPVSTEPVRQLGEAAPTAPEVEMDDDGFAPVKSKGRKRR